MSLIHIYLIGLPLGVALILTQPHGIRPHRGVYRVLDWIVNIGRSVPFIILMVAIMPFTRMAVSYTHLTSRAASLGTTPSWESSCPSRSWWRRVW